ncbi:hypothetical protein ABZZ44_32755 [Streptomyces sp. NPDC006460]|uniref:hypothetical protein n=1 Tax=Streptomyces sp. NPDC006460 TaxID=3154304 RepID=UPI0033B147D6
MTGHFTDRDERLWQRRAELRVARPLPVGTWIRRLATATRRHRDGGAARRPGGAAVPRGREPAQSTG